MADTPTPTVILLAEDEALVRMFAADLLREEAGFKVIGPRRSGTGRHAA
jgi:hypothetical protein